MITINGTSTNPQTILKYMRIVCIKNLVDYDLIVSPTYFHAESKTATCTISQRSLGYGGEFSTTTTVPTGCKLLVTGCAEEALEYIAGETIKDSYALDSGQTQMSFALYKGEILLDIVVVETLSGGADGASVFVLTMYTRPTSGTTPDGPGNVTIKFLGTGYTLTPTNTS